MTFFEPATRKGDWKPELPPSVKRAFEHDVHRCGKCGTRDDVGTNEDGAPFCLPCWGAGGCGFAWWRS